MLSKPIADTDLPDIVIGVLNYNRSSETLRTLTSLNEINYPSDKLGLVLIDNASTDGTPDIIREHFGDRVEIIQVESNIGPVARNRVMFNRNERYIFVFDEDCVPQHNNTIRDIVEFMESNPYFGALCFQSFNYHLNIFEYGHTARTASHQHPNGIFEGMFVIGNGMCFRRDAIEKTDGYDERLFWGAEEYDLALELLYHDVPIATHPNFALIHYHAPRAHSSARSNELDMRNNIWISARRFPLLLVIPIIAFHIVRRLAASLIKADKERVKGYLQGIRKGFARLPEFLGDRRPISVKKLIRHGKWFVQMFYAPSSFRKEHAAALGHMRGEPSK